MQEMQARQQMQLPRLEAVDEPEVNKALFTLYNGLIEPLADIERTASEISSARQVLAECSRPVTYSPAGTAMNALKKIPKTFLIMTAALGLFYSTAINWLIEDSGFKTPEILEPVLNPTLTGALECIAVLSILLSFFTEFKTALSSVHAENKHRKEAYGNAAASLSRLEPELERQVSRIKNAIQFVPPKYRFSDALRYFVDSYSNSRVDNLKEAVNAYDTNYFRSLSVRMQQQMMGQLQQNTQLLQDIAFQQLANARQLSSIQEDIRLSNTF